MRETIFTNCAGQNNQATPDSVPFDPKKGGINFLVSSSDVVIGKTGKLSGCRAGASVSSGAWQSTYPATGGFYAVCDQSTDSAIYKVTPKVDGTISKTGIRAGLAKGARVDFCTVADDTYWLNGFQCGVLVDETEHAWPTSLWPGPEVTAQMVPLPIGKHIDILAGRILTTKDDELFFSEYALPGLMDKTRNNRRFESRLRMVYSVQTGVYVSDERAVHFLAGNDPNQWQLKTVLEYPALEWARAPRMVNPSDFGIESTEMSALFGTPNGPVVGLPDGPVFNLTDKGLKLPGCSTTGAILVVDKTLILQEV
jgi:hypothetical protein